MNGAGESKVGAGGDGEGEADEHELTTDPFFSCGFLQA